jgi:hypothetical protein
VTASEWLEILQSMPEIRTLSECSRRAGIRFGLRGGVVRNLVLSEGREFGAYDSLYDFVDPFGDIDLIALSESDQNSLARILYQSVPFADFHSWDFGLAGQAERTALRRGVVAADRLVLWFDGQQEGKLTLDSFGGEVDKILYEPGRLQRERNRPAGGRNVIEDLLRTMKAARVQLQALNESGVVARHFSDEVGEIGERLRSWKPERRQSLWRGRVSRVEIELAQLILNAPDWPQTLRFLTELKNNISGEWLATSEALSTMLSSDVERSTKLGMALYRPHAGASYRFEVNTSSEEPSSNETDAPGNEFRNRVPWTRLTLRSTKESTCCTYSDFEEGIGVIAWRTLGGEGMRGDQELNAQDYGVAARPALGAAENWQKFDQGDLIPMSGYTRKGRSIAIRFDTAYLKLITGGRYSTFLVGLLRVSDAQDVESSGTSNPGFPGPQGERLTEPIWKDETSEREQVYLTPTTMIMR